MTKLVRDMDRRPNPLNGLQAAWVAAFLGVVLIIGVTFVAMIALAQ
jgi:hypothetical protein